MSKNGMDRPCSRPNRSENERGLRSTRSTSPCPIRQLLQSLTPIGIDTGKNQAAPELCLFFPQERTSSDHRSMSVRCPTSDSFTARFNGEA
jgi:hypothetical protein